MTLETAIRCLSVDCDNAKSYARGAEPEVRMPLSLARLYLEAMHDANTIIDRIPVTVITEMPVCNCPEAGTSGSCPQHDTHSDVTRFPTSTVWEAP